MAEASDDGSMEDKISALPDGILIHFPIPPALTRCYADMRAVTALAVPLAVGVLHRRVFRGQATYTNLEMENNYRWCPTFSNLTNLTLDSWCVHADLYALIVFLQNSPSLKKLTLKLNEPRYHNGVVSAIIGELEDRSFTCEQLEIVEIICSEGNELLPGVNQFLLEESGIRPDQMRVSHQN